MNEKLLEILVCPLTRNKLILKNHFEIPIKKIIYLNKKWFYNYNK